MHNEIDTCDRVKGPHPGARRQDGGATPVGELPRRYVEGETLLKTGKSREQQEQRQGYSAEGDGSSEEEGWMEPLLPVRLYEQLIGGDEWKKREQGEQQPPAGRHWRDQLYDAFGFRVLEQPTPPFHPNRCQLRSPAAVAVLDPFAHIPAGLPPARFQPPPGSAAARCQAACF